MYVVNRFKIFSSSIPGRTRRYCHMRGVSFINFSSESHSRTHSRSSLEATSLASAWGDPRPSPFNHPSELLQGSRPTRWLSRKKWGMSDGLSKLSSTGDHGSLQFESVVLTNSTPPRALNNIRPGDRCSEIATMEVSSSRRDAFSHKIPRKFPLPIMCRGK